MLRRPLLNPSCRPLLVSEKFRGSSASVYSGTTCACTSLASTPASTLNHPSDLLSKRNLHEMKVIDKIKAKAKAKAPFFSFEFFPPKTDEGLRNLFSRVERLAGLSPVFIDVTWDASKPASNDKTLLICKVAQQYFGVDAMMHICLTSMSKAELRSVLTRAKEAGIENVLALRGDPPKGKEWKPVEDGLAYGADLIRFIRKEFGDHFCIACAGYPEGHMDNPDAEADLAHLKAKVDAGADFVMSQLFYDADLFLEFVKRCRNKGIECPILPGIMPIQSYRGFDRMT